MKTALITGASKGLGLEWCRQLAQEGYTVILTARSGEQAAQAAELLKEEKLYVTPYGLEVTNEEQLAACAAWLQQHFGKLDVLINNAGINSGTRAKDNKQLASRNLVLAQLDPGEVLNMVEVNAIAPILVVKHFRSLLAAAGQAKVIHIGSWLGSISGKSNGGNYSYAVSKSALNMMNRALAFDVLDDGIITVVANPGWVQTDMGGKSAPLTPAQSVEGMRKNILHKITLADTGKFISYEGTIMPW